jgi:hypothetical protein
MQQRRQELWQEMVLCALQAEKDAIASGHVLYGAVDLNMGQLEVAQFAFDFQSVLSYKTSVGTHEKVYVIACLGQEGTIKSPERSGPYNSKLDHIVLNLCNGNGLSNLNDETAIVLLERKAISVNS